MFSNLRLLCCSLALPPYARPSSLHDNLARRVADRDRLGPTGGEVDDGDIVRAFVGHVGCFAVAGSRRPVWLFADRNVARRLVRCRIEQGQLTWALYDDDAELRAGWITDEMGRYARWDLRYDLVRDGIKHLN